MYSRIEVQYGSKATSTYENNSNPAQGKSVFEYIALAFGGLLLSTMPKGMTLIASDSDCRSGI